jgi:hypothetical protein
VLRVLNALSAQSEMAAVRIVENHDEIDDRHSGSMCN